MSRSFFKWFSRSNIRRSDSVRLGAFSVKTIDMKCKAGYEAGYSFEVIDFKGDLEIRERIRELGIRQGSMLTFIRRTPFGGPCLFKTASTLLALREEEMACLNLKSL